MKLKFSFTIGLFFLSLMMLASCVSLRAAFNSELTMKERHYIAYKDFNDNLQDYLVAYRIAPLEKQSEWKSKIDPIFKKAKEALDSWELALGTSTETSKEQAWLNIKDQLLAAMFQYGIIQLE